MMEHYAKKYSDPELMTKRGLLSGAIWILTFAIFALIWIVFSIKYAWIVFIFAVALEMFIEYWMQTKRVKH